MIDAGDGYTPTPAISHAILTYNRGRTAALADGIVVTPSHNPPDDGGFKYNPPHGGPADTEVTTLDPERGERAAATRTRRGVSAHPVRAGASSVPRRTATTTSPPTSTTSPHVIDIDAIRERGLRLGVDPLGGASVAYWAADRRALQARSTIVNDAVDPTFGFMPRRLGRQDPHGLLLALRDGEPHRR